MGSAPRLCGSALIARARESVRVRVLYDWLGTLGGRASRLWARLRDAGAEVRCYTPPAWPRRSAG